MSKKTIAVLKGYFVTGARPTELQFADFIDSFVHKDNAGITVTEKSFNEVTGLLYFAFSDGSTLSATIPQSADIGFINGLQEALDLKVNKVAGKSLTSNDYSNDEKAKVTAAVVHEQNADAHVSTLKDFIWSNKLSEWVAGETIINSGKPTYRVSGNKILKLNILSAEYPYTTPAAIDLAKWEAVLDYSEKLDSGEYAGNAMDLYNLIQSNTAAVRTVSINGNPFGLVKRPSNNLATLEIGDFVKSGAWDDTEIWGWGQYVGGDVDLKASWKILERIKDIPVI